MNVLLPECVPLPCEAPDKVGVSLIFINLHNTAARPHFYHLNTWLLSSTDITGQHYLQKSIVSSQSQPLPVSVPAHSPNFPVEELPGEERLGQRCLGIK